MMCASKALLAPLLTCSHLFQGSNNTHQFSLTHIIRACPIRIVQLKIFISHEPEPLSVTEPTITEVEVNLLARR